MNTFINKLKEYGCVNEEIEKELEAKVKRIVRQKGDFLLKKGQRTSGLFVIEKGLVRAYYTKEGREINSWFGFENIILGSIMPVFYNLPSSESIQCLETSIIHYISMSDLEKLYEKYSLLNTIGRKMAEEYCMILEERINSLQTQTAEQRYKNLLAVHPEAIQRISLGHIASYLGISQETLSRVRSK
ncbi:Crp/Fnr family transcriptional regulator [Sphingobacterium mizutaii]|uniref:Crp/Fnr family transcriptional regulator n=1 Tax=Sphingobacterium mizutaii TaxID=1010 RepID=UPI001623469F|nr:Crp/Fnr family transcriptional regulator [Sphingobacterium mizutaii]